MQLSEIRKYSCVWVLVSIGSLRKVELGQEVHISKFILKGLEMWENKDSECFEGMRDNLEFSYLSNLISQLIFVKNNLKK